MENFILCVVVCVSIVKINFQRVALIIDNPFLFRNEADRDGVLLFKWSTILREMLHGMTWLFIKYCS